MRGCFLSVVVCNWTDLLDLFELVVPSYSCENQIASWFDLYIFFLFFHGLTVCALGLGFWFLFATLRRANR